MTGTSSGWKKRRGTIDDYISERIVVSKNGCWVWRGCKKGRYGWFQFDGWILGAHQALYILRVGKIPKGKIVRHTCDDTRCVNPKHLVLGTKKDNRQDFMERNPRARAICLKAARAGALAVKKFWDRMTPTQRKRFINRRAKIQAMKRAA